MVVGGINFLPPQASCIFRLNTPSFENIWFGILVQLLVNSLTNSQVTEAPCLVSQFTFLQNVHDKKILNS